MKDKPISSYRISEYAKKFASYSKYHSIDIHENNIEQMTVHTSKGKEADYVVVFDMNKGGFPSEKSTNPLLELLLPKSEPYKHAEERRLILRCAHQSTASRIFNYRCQQAIAICC
ncbi:MAG: 3'-5' exonuclease [Methylotenera sp.]